MSKMIGFQQGQLSNIGLDTGEPFVPNATATYLNIDGETASSLTEQTSPSFQDGRLYFGLRPAQDVLKMTINNKEVNIGKHRAYIYLDHEEDDGVSNRYVVASPFDATLRFKDSNPQSKDAKTLEIINLQNIPLAELKLPFLWADIDDTKHGNLTLQGGSLYLTTNINPNAKSTISQVIDENEKPYLSINGSTNLNNDFRVEPAGNVSVANNLSIKRDKATLSYNDITQSLDFTFN